MSNNAEDYNIGIRAIFVIFWSVIAVICLGLWGCPNYHVYEQRLTGEAELARATYSKQVAVQEAQAKFEAAESLAKAEIRRAEGVAKANTIIGESLKNNESYLRYLWINNLDHEVAKTVIYIPTEAGLPILEAGRHKE
jgi:predicted aminopeptidase